ncbi:MAG: TlpA family protein disulfide reductase [Planctomycetota bacterium]|jgi:peroxiredoxin
MILQQAHRAPDFRIASVGGRSSALYDFLGRPVLVFGWGSWHPSRGTLGALQAFHAEHSDVTVVSVAFEVQGPPSAMRYLRPAKATFEMLLDATCVLTRRWGVKDVPFTVLLDAEGYVQHVGKDFDAKAVEAALAKKPARKGETQPQFTREDFNLDLLAQDSNIFLSRGRSGDAVHALRRAAKAYPDNLIIAGQIPAIESPEKVYGG